VARAKKLVVLTAGTLSTPQILERSGIGGKEVLNKFGIKQLVDLPGVGENYQGFVVLAAGFMQAVLTVETRSSARVSAVLRCRGP
jgi:alcohol oxidase